MEKNAKISLIASDMTIYDYAYKVAKGNDLYRDIVSDILLYLYDLPSEKFDKINDLKSYVCKMIYFSWNSSTSPFYRKYRLDNDYKLKDDATFQEDSALKELEQIEIRISKNRYPTEVRLLEMYIELGTYEAVGKAVGATPMGVYKQIQKVLKELKSKI